MKGAKRSKTVSYNKWGYIFLIPFVVVYIIFQLIPLITTIVNSFYENYRSGLTQVGPNFIGFENYITILQNKDLWTYAQNTLVMWVMGFIPQILVSLLMAGMMGIDTSLFEAAEVDGATSTQVFLKITLPLLRPILVYVMITSLIGGLQMFDVPQILTNATGDPMRSTMTLIMYLNKHLFSKNYGMAGALSVLLFIVTGILSMIVYKVSSSNND